MLESKTVIVFSFRSLLISFTIVVDFKRGKVESLRDIKL